jgi:hypothetical protein
VAQSDMREPPFAGLSLGQPDHSGEGSLCSTTFVNNPG